jgi:hypothetical protein
VEVQVLSSALVTARASGPSTFLTTSGRLATVSEHTFDKEARC